MFRRPTLKVLKTRRTKVRGLLGLGYRYGVQEQVFPKNFGVVAEGKSSLLQPSVRRPSTFQASRLRIAA